VTTKKQVQDEINESEALAAASAQLAAKIAQSESSSASGSGAASSGAEPAPSSGFIWPVSGPITSPFGMRWGSLHPGIDIAAGTGTPIRAAASGHVVSAAYSGGYGYLTVIDHGSGLATAYAHQSRLGTSAGAAVSQGQVIGYVGSTGFSTGPHLHFEVRVNGSPVDPLGYL
jgi:murein DD-endopeptidase MepM/ murein hydrolase activator NlpD